MIWIIRIILAAVFLLNGFTAVHAQSDKVVTLTLNPAKAAGNREVVITASEAVFRTGTTTDVWFYKKGGTDRILKIYGSPILPEGFKRWAEIIPGGEKVPSILATQQLSFVVPTPTELEPGKYEVGANIGREQQRAPFTVLSRVERIFPKEGNHTTPIEISGDGFGFAADNTVYLDRDDGFDTYPGNEKLEIITTLTKKLRVMIPGQTPIGSYLLRVYTKEEESEYQVSQKFLLRPHLTVLLPFSEKTETGTKEDGIGLGGLYFHQDKTKVKVVFYRGGEKKGETLAEKVLPGGGVVSAKIPSSLPSGIYEVMVAVEDTAKTGTFIESDNSFSFRYSAPPVITPPPVATPRPPPTPTPIPTPLPIPIVTTPSPVVTLTPAPTPAPLLTPSPTPPPPFAALPIPQFPPPIVAPASSTFRFILIGIALFLSILVVCLLWVCLRRKRRKD